MPLVLLTCENERPEDLCFASRVIGDNRAVQRSRPLASFGISLPETRGRRCGAGPFRILTTTSNVFSFTLHSRSHIARFSAADHSRCGRATSQDRKNDHKRATQCLGTVADRGYRACLTRCCRDSPLHTISPASRRLEDINLCIG